MKKLNLFWPVYKNLEKEFLILADYIHFSDDQLNVYSMHIADLIIRCSIEIEAISKELYYDEGGNAFPVDDNGNARDLYFDTDCIELLEQKWKLSKKQIIVSATNFYFSNQENRVLTPLHKANKRGTSGSKWKQAYQAVKHDRKNSLKNASIKNLLHALGALYILNLYYKSETIDIGFTYMSTNRFDNRAGSDIFSVFDYNACALSMSAHMDDSCITQLENNDLDKSIYIVKYDNESFAKIHRSFCLDEQITINNFNKSTAISEFLKARPDYKGKSINEICMEAGGTDLLRNIISFKHTQEERTNRTEAVINKHSSIYPSLSSVD